MGQSISTTAGEALPVDRHLDKDDGFELIHKRSRIERAPCARLEWAIPMPCGARGRSAVIYHFDIDEVPSE